MLATEQIRAELGNTLGKSDFKLPNKYEGKVRDNYSLPGGKRLIVTTDRISCFDHIVGSVPFKGQVLNQIAAFWFDHTKFIVKNHMVDVPDPNVMVVKECKALPVEVIVRGYITGSLWRDYKSGKRDIYGIKFPEGMMHQQPFDMPILTPSTKAEHGGHDVPITPQEIVGKKLVDRETWKKVEIAALKLFDHGTEILARQNLILVDTKYEFGLLDGEVVLIDEIHTPDSSRFWYLDTYKQLFEEGKEQKQMDKEYVRQWLINERNWMGDGPIPGLSDEVRIEAARRYIEVYEQMTGKEFSWHRGNVLQRVTENLKKKGYLK
jgi:phosphoribosylaminoimidazole-succinocarboxamide synthase